LLRAGAPVRRQHPRRVQQRSSGESMSGGNALRVDGVWAGGWLMHDGTGNSSTTPKERSRRAR
jgi:hypothetical protein